MSLGYHQRNILKLLTVITSVISGLEKAIELYNSLPDFGIAYFRDDLKSAGLNPEINVQHQENRSNPHHTQELDKIKKFLGFNGEDGIYDQWKSKYSLDVIGTSYCRSRTIPCTANEFEQMRAFKNAKQSFVQSHYTWAEAIQKDMRDITLALKDYKYVKDAIDLCGALGLDIINQFNISNENVFFNQIDAYTQPALDLYEDDMFDFIIDDGPHTPVSQQFTIQKWINKLKPGGKIIIEDIGCKDDNNNTLSPDASLDFLLKSIDTNISTYKIFDLRNSGQYDSIILEINK